LTFLKLLVRPDAILLLRMWPLGVWQFWR